jgi:hypothetical protein
MKAHSHGEFVCIWSSCKHTFNMRSFDLVDSPLTNHKFVSCVTQHAPVISSSAASISAPKEIIVGIRVWWTWWPRPPTPEVLYKSIRQDTATKHIMWDAEDDIRCLSECTILLEKCCVHMPCSLNEQNDFILQVLQIPLDCYGALHEVQIALACWMHSTRYIFQDGMTPPWLCVDFQRSAIEVDMDFIIKPQAV